MEKKPIPSEIRFYYEKNPSYRIIYTDGIIGGITPTKAVNLNFYATRPTIPKSTIHPIVEDNKISPEGVPSEDSKIGIMREIEIGIYMNIRTAKEVYEFLKNLLEAENLLNQK